RVRAGAAGRRLRRGHARSRGGVAAVRATVRRGRARCPRPRIRPGATHAAGRMSTPPGMARPVSAAGALARYRLVDTSRAEVLLRELGVWDGHPAGPGADGILDALTRTADPDLARRQLRRLTEADPAVLVGLRRNPSLRERVLAVLGASDTLGDHLVANPGEWRTLAAPNGYALR